jgi:ADP-ribose pyrophosphatase
LVPLGGIHTNTGLLGEYVVLFIANINQLGGFDKKEGIRSVELFNISELQRMITQGQVTDSFTLAAILMACSRGLLPNWTCS